MMDEDDKGPRSAFDDRHRGSALRKKYKRPASVRGKGLKKPAKCAACGGEHYTRYCTMGR